MSEEELITFLKSEGYVQVQEKGDQGICGLFQMIYTWGIIVDMDEGGFNHRFCYSTFEEAEKEFNAWSGDVDTDPENYIKRKG